LIVAVKIIELFFLIIASVYCDFKFKKIKNYIVYPAIIIGVVTNTVIDGISGFGNSALAIFIPIILLWVFYILRMLGAGDIKLFSSIGAIMGIRFMLAAFAYSFLAGGVIAIVIIIYRKNALSRFKYLIDYFKKIFIFMKVEKYQEFEEGGKVNGLFRFSYAIAVGVILTIIDGFFAFSISLYNI